MTIHLSVALSFSLFFYLVLVLLFFFFFQAEDGIRDLTVTGVQTCALPIYHVLAIGQHRRAVGRVGDTDRAVRAGHQSGRTRAGRIGGAPRDIRSRPADRSEERRVGKEGRSRWSPYH